MGSAVYSFVFDGFHLIFDRSARFPRTLQSVLRSVTPFAVRRLLRVVCLLPLTHLPLSIDLAGSGLEYLDLGRLYELLFTSPDSYWSTGAVLASWNSYYFSRDGQCGEQSANVT